MVQLIRAENPSEAWLKAVKLILRGGKEIAGLKEIPHLLIEIESPLKIEESVHEAFCSIQKLGRRSGKEWVEECIKHLSQSTSGSETYYSRLVKYRKKVDQLNYIIETLKKKPNSNQLFCTTFDPETDIKPDLPYNPNMPCLVAMDFKDRGALNLFALFRSHDFGRKAYGNYIALGKLLKEVCEKSGRKIGKLICFSCSAHIRKSELRQIKSAIEGLKAEDSRT